MLASLAQKGNFAEIMLSPIMIAARPITIAPTPIVTDALLC